MNDDRRYELISAYLDDELTPAERAEAEQLLAEDASVRQLYQELRALSETLRALPREELDEAFADQVLRRAERTVLTQREDKNESASGGGSGIGWLAKIPFGRNPRSWGWAAAAIAAAVLLMIFNPEQKPEQVPVARHAPQASSDAEMSALNEPEMYTVPETMRAAPHAEQATQGDQDAESRIAEDHRTEDHRTEPASPEAETAAPPMTLRRMASSPERAETAAKRARGVPSAAAGDTHLAEQLARLSRSGVMVVQLDVTSQAASQSALEEILAHQAITLGSLAESSTEKAQAQPSEPEIAPLAQDEVLRGADPAQLPLQMVYLEAAAEAVEAALADLAARPQDFPVIAVEPAPDAQRQQALVHYARGEAQRPQPFSQEDTPSAAPLAMRRLPAGHAQKMAPLSAEGAAAPNASALDAAPSSGVDQSPVPREPLGRAQRVRTLQEVPQAPPSAAAGPEQDQPAPAAPAPADDSATNPAEKPDERPLRVLFLLRVQPDGAKTAPPPADAQ